MNVACNNSRRSEAGPVLAGPSDAAAVVRLSVGSAHKQAVVLLLCDPEHRLLLAITVEGAPVTGVSRALDLVLQVADSGGIAGVVVGIVRGRGGRLSRAEEASLAGLLTRCDGAGVDLLDVLVVGKRGYRSVWHLAEATVGGEDGDQ